MIPTLMGLPGASALALITRLEERLCPHQAARQIAGVLMKIAGHLSRRHVRAALHLEGADIAIKLGGSVPEHITLVHLASDVQHLVVGTNVDAPPPIPAKVIARESAVGALTGVTNWDVRHDPAADQPAEETASSVRGVGRKPFRLQIEAPLGAIEHGLCRFNLVIGTRWRGLDIDNDGILDIDQVVDPIAELHPLARALLARIPLGLRP
jgi:hypothetical protein